METRKMKKTIKSNKNVYQTMLKYVTLDGIPSIYEL